MSSLACRLCGKPIKFDDNHVSERTGKRIPLDVDTQEPHDCSVWKVSSSQQYQQPQQPQPPPHQQEQQLQQPQQKQKERRYLQCNKGCGQEIYFDANHSKSLFSISIPFNIFCKNRGNECIFTNTMFLSIFI
ncbi:MAG: hypothetical protein ACJ71R_12525 [Nitrososphaeraceae archaeon]